MAARSSEQRPRAGARTRMLAGVSVDYYVRMERGSLGGASESVLDALARALNPEDADRDHLFALARVAGEGRTRRSRAPQPRVRPAVQQVIDAITDAPAWIRNGRHDILAMNPLARALYAAMLEDPRRPANTTRFVYLQPERARELFVDYDQIARDAAAMLRLEAGRKPPRQEAHRTGRRTVYTQRACSASGGPHRTCATTAVGEKRLRHPVVRLLDLDFEAMELPSEPGLQLNVYTAAAGTPTSDALKLLASCGSPPPRTTRRPRTPAIRRPYERVAYLRPRSDRR